MSAATVTFAETVSAAILSSGGLWGLLQTVLTRRERKIKQDNAVDKARQDEIDRERAEKDRHDLLAEAQSTAQRTALDSSAVRYQNLETDYLACRQGLNEVRDAASLLIDVFDNVMMKLRPTRANSETFTVTMEAAEVTKVRRSISEARRHLLYFNFAAWKVPLEGDPKE